MLKNPKTSDSLVEIRQTAAELLAAALCDLFPNTQLIDSSVSEMGFQYDAIIPQKIDAQSVAYIEERMRSLMAQAIPIKQVEMVRTNAMAFLRHHKRELLAEKLGSESSQVVTLFMMDSFVDLCSFPFLNSTAAVKAFKILSFNQIEIELPGIGLLKVTRFQGTAFPDTASLKIFLKRKQEAKTRNHVTLVEEMELSLPLQHSGCWMWQQRGLHLKTLLKNLAFNIQKPHTFIPFSIPLLSQKRKNESVSINLGGTPYVFSDANDLISFLFQKSPISETQLPMRLYTSTYAINQSPTSQLTGLLDPRIGEIERFHIFCKKEQFEEELTSSLQFIYKIIMLFGFEHQWVLYPTSSSGCKCREDWKEGLEALKSAMNILGIHYILDKQGENQYGPRVEIKLADALGRYWTGPFVALDVTHPHSLNLYYQSEKGEKQQLMMIERSLFGMVERFIAILIEHTAGLLPFWVVPEHFRVMTLGDTYADYATEVWTVLEKEGFRGSIDSRLSPLSDKIRKAEMERLPYLLIVGEKEAKKNVITVRSRSHAQHSITTKSFLEQLQRDLKHSLQEGK